MVVNTRTRASSGTPETGKKIFGEQREESAESDEADADSGDAADAGEEQVFNPELAEDLPA